MAVVVAAALSWAASVVTGIAAFLAAVLVIGVRGYLVPGTPTITERYLPDRVLVRFDKHDAAATDHDVGAIDDVEAFLVDEGVFVERGADGALSLADGVTDAWRERIGSVGPESDVSPHLDPLVSADTASVAVDASAGEFAVSATGDHVGRWPSREAFFADATAAAVLEEEITDWESVTGRDRRNVLASLRVFLDVCPTCGGAPEIAQRSGDSCCRSQTLTVVVCAGCDARFLDGVDV